MISEFDCFPIAYTVAYYKGLGWLPIAHRNGEEIYRGDFQSTATDALNRVLEANL